MLTLFAFVVTLAVLVVAHEYGHYLAARICGVKVLRFSIGFGRTLFRRTFGKDETEFVIAFIPLGGYVKMLDEREMEVSQGDTHRAFNRQSVWKRMIIVLAGPMANLMLAIVLYTILFLAGVTGMKPLIGGVVPESPAAKASLKSGEMIVRVNGVKVRSWEEVRWAIIKQSLNSDHIQIDATEGADETHVHQVQIDSLGQQDFQDDLLNQLGFKPAKPKMLPIVGEVISSGAAFRDGLKVNDLILTVNDNPIKEWDVFVKIVRDSPSKTLVVVVERDHSPLKIRLTPEASDEAGKTIGKIGAAYRMQPEELGKYLVEIRYPFTEALFKAVGKTWDTSVTSVNMLISMIKGGYSWKGLSGPATIAEVAGQSAQVGWKAFVGFLALVSISLGVLNLMPVPVLDGGHLMYYIAEVVKGSPVSEKVMEIGQKAGLTLLGLLMVIALYNDFNRLFAG